MRRAINCVYCDPKSRMTTVSKDVDKRSLLLEVVPDEQSCELKWSIRESVIGHNAGKPEENEDHAKGTKHAIFLIYLRLVLRWRGGVLHFGYRPAQAIDEPPQL